MNLEDTNFIAISTQSISRDRMGGTVVAECTVYFVFGCYQSALLSRRFSLFGILQKLIERYPPTYLNDFILYVDKNTILYFLEWKHFNEEQTNLFKYEFDYQRTVVTPPLH